MKVLHVFNVAGVASTLAKYQKKMYKWDTWVITRKKYDPYGLTVYGRSFNDPKYLFIIRALITAKKYDLIHVHDFDKIVPWLKRLYSNKPIIIHYHGTRIRGKWQSREKYWSKSDAILASTSDLLEGAPKHVIYLPNPVDTELFYPMPKLRKAGTALYIIKHQYGEDLEWPRKVAEKLKLQLVVRDRIKDPIPYRELPRFLNKFEYYIDRNYISSLSKTALEALACGLKVVRWDGKIVKSMPSDHKPETVIRCLKGVYETLIPQ